MNEKKKHKYSEQELKNYALRPCLLFPLTFLIFLSVSDNDSQCENKKSRQNCFLQVCTVTLYHKIKLWIKLRHFLKMVLYHGLRVL